VLKFVKDISDTEFVAGETEARAAA
jgi:hypothetical protein